MGFALLYPLCGQQFIQVSGSIRFALGANREFFAGLQRSVILIWFPVVFTVWCPRNKGFSLLRFSSLIQYVTPYRGVLLLALLLMLGESAISLATPWLAGQFTQGLLENNQPLGMSLHSLLLIWLGVFAVQAILRFGNRYLIGHSGQKMLAELRMRLYDHLQSLPLNYYHERKRGKILTLLTNDAQIVSGFVTGTLLGLLPYCVTLIGALLFIFLIDPRVALLVAFLVPLFYLMTKLIGRRIRSITRDIIDQYANTFSIIEENLNLLPVIKSFTQEEAESARFQEGNLRLLNLISRQLRIQSLLSPVIRFLATAGIILLLWVGVGQVQDGSMTPSDLVSLLLYGMLMVGPVSGLADVYGSVQYTRGAAERLLTVFAESPEPHDEGREILSAERGEISFEDVHFSYPGREKLLQGLSLQIAVGETVAITGENGTGKSTLAHLLVRFINPTQGRILIDGMDIRSVTLRSLREQIGMVQQQVLLLNGTIRDNIAFGQPEVSFEAIEQAARAAHALTFIEQLPQGFDTLIGDQGVMLSGGQKQRLALARVLLKDPCILILDEATAMFDPEGEKSFIAECHELLHQYTVILITHRPASLALADRLLKLENGKLMSKEQV